MNNENLSKCVILLSGASPTSEIFEGSITICADSGILPLIESNIFPDYLVGDMDSVSDDIIELAGSKGTDIHKYPQEKDLGDGEIALRLALSKRPGTIEIYGGKCGRTDHILSSIQLLNLIPAGILSSLYLGDDQIILIREGEKRRMKTNRRIISVLPCNSPCVISVQGLKWELEHEEVPFGSTRCIHNENLNSPFTISTDKGDIYLIISDEKS